VVLPNPLPLFTGEGEISDKYLNPNDLSLAIKKNAGL